MPNNSAVFKFLDEILHKRTLQESPSIHITLTFAQSVDAKIAGRGGQQLILSCNESMFMTHRYCNRFSHPIRSAYVLKCRLDYDQDTMLSSSESTQL